MTEQLGRDYGTDYDMNSPDLAKNWTGVVEELHSSCPIARSEVGEGYWVLNRQADIKHCTQDWETFSSATGFMPDRPKEMPWLFPVEADPPLHTALRTALNPYLSPGVVRNYEDPVRQHARDLLANFQGQTEINAVTQFANAVPGRAFCVTVAGMPVDEIEYLQGKFEIGIVGPLEKRAAAMQDATDYIAAYLAKRAEEPPRGDVVSAILELDFDGFDWDAKVSALTTLTLGGVGTTGYAIASSLHYLATHPEQRKRLIAEPTLWPAAVEEFLRYFSASPHDGRRVTKPVTVAGLGLDKGDYVIMSYGAASRDPAVFENPHDVVIDRPLPNRHLSFGYGIHRCIGSHLARLEMTASLQEFLACYPDFSVPQDFEPEYQINNTVVMVSLPLILG